MRATAATMMTAAATVRPESASPRNIALKTKATTGLTYAYVAILGSGATRSSQT